MSEKLQGGLLAGSVDLSIPVILRSTTDNTEATGKVFGDVTASYWRQGGIRVDIPAITLAAVNSAHADGGFKEIDSTNMPGNYRFDLPDAAQATGADWVVVSIKVAGCYVFFQMFYLTVGFNTTVPDVAGTAASLHTTTNSKIDTNKSELDGLQGTDGKCLISTDAQDLSGSFDVNTKTATATALDFILKDSTFALAMADAIWDEILTGTTHNIAGSSGRRVREIGAFAIESGTAQAGTSISITLAATADFGDGVFNRNLIVLTDNTGKGQTRTIVDSDAASKVIIVDREWRVIPDDTTEYQITPDDTPLVVDHGVARGGTDTTITIREYASSNNNAYWCNIVAIMAGKGRGQARLVGAYDGTSKVVTICGENWVEIPDTTSVYAMMPYGTTCTACLSPSALALINTEVDNALNTVIPVSPTAGSINERIKSLPSGIAKNVALPNLDIYMLLEDGITAATGKTVTGQIRKDAGSFTGLTNAITEVSGGLYTIADGIIQAEMNADKVTLKFTAADCRDTIMMIYPT